MNALETCMWKRNCLKYANWLLLFEKYSNCKNLLIKNYSEQCNEMITRYEQMTFEFSDDSILIFSHT